MTAKSYGSIVMIRRSWRTLFMSRPKLIAYLQRDAARRLGEALLQAGMIESHVFDTQATSTGEVGPCFNVKIRVEVPQ